MRHFLFTEYIGDIIRYRRALGYAEGKQAASLDLSKQVLNGDFDAEAMMETDYVANRICDIMKKNAKRTHMGKG